MASNEEARDDGGTRAELLTYREVAGMIGVPLGTLYEKVARREIPHVRLGRRLVRFERSAIDAWLRDRRVPGAPAEPGSKGMHE